MKNKLIFEVIDELCPWNTGIWKVETSENEVIISRTKGQLHLVMPVSTLAMILFDQISPSEAARMARFDVIDHGALSSWDKVMRTSVVSQKYL